MNRRQAFQAARVLWKQHCSEAVPLRLVGKRVQGIEVTSLDTYAAGCIQTFIDRKGKLDLWRTAILGRCYRDISVVALSLKGREKAYYKRLMILTGLVLQMVQLGVQSPSHGRFTYVLEGAA
jgi:hypothetical protein